MDLTKWWDYIYNYEIDVCINYVVTYLNCPSEKKVLPVIMLMDLRPTFFTFSRNGCIKDGTSCLYYRDSPFIFLA